MGELGTRIDRHFKFSGNELFMLVMTALIAAFGLTMSAGWGFFNIVEDQTPTAYLLNLTLILIFVTIALLIHVSIQKIIGLHLGYAVTYMYWPIGFVISLFITFISFGFLPFFFVGNTWSTTQDKLRMGRFRYGMMQKDSGVIAFIGPFANVVIALICGFVYVATESPALFSFIVANLLVAIYSLIPIPVFRLGEFKGGTSGIYLFIASRWIYVFTLTLVLVFALLIMIAQIFSLIISLILAIFVTIIYRNAHEK